MYPNYAIQDINSRLCGSYCLKFFSLIERMNRYDTISKMYFGYMNMPINVFGNSSKNSENTTDTTLIVQKPHLRDNFIKANIEENHDFKNKSRIEKFTRSYIHTRCSFKTLC